MFLGGTLGQTIEDMTKIYDRSAPEYITLIYHWAQQPKDVRLEELSIFMEKVLPNLEAPDVRIAAE